MPFLLLFIINFIISPLKENLEQLHSTQISINDLSFESTSYLGIDRDYTNNLNINILNECSINIKTMRNLKNSTLDDFITTSTKITNTSTKIINDHQWRYYTNGYINYYFAENNNTYYTLTTEVLNNNKMCKKSIDILVKSLTFK